MKWHIERLMSIFTKPDDISLVVEKKWENMHVSNILALLVRK